MTTVAVAVHHIFRLGPELIVPGVILVALPVVLLVVARARRSLVASVVFAALVALIFVWFGVVDGVLDHLLKALGLENLTFLPGGEAEVVATFYSLGSASTSAAFYEATGVVEALASMVMLGFAAAFVASQITAHRRVVLAAA
ncbi:hypothetical protein [Agromyces sp. Leaf222]|uniref:hypothetical protein n=1 Tax=Agromyces sp. Leaf222 TaxID=1735688 RepID=UPI0012FA740E|nr:hypothetical protein [Agromyces sp. Leaf222]